MKEVKIAATVIYHPDFFVLHERLKGNDRGEVDKLGIYGGKFNPKKDDKNNLATTASRELHEESGMLFLPERFSHDGHVTVISKEGKKKTLVEAEIYRLLIQEEQVEELRNGIPMDIRAISRAKALGQLTTVASACFSKYYGA